MERPGPIRVERSLPMPRATFLAVLLLTLAALGPLPDPSGVELALGPVPDPFGVELALGPLPDPNGVELA
jgi:hypothetical protein